MKRRSTLGLMMGRIRDSTCTAAASVIVLALLSGGGSRSGSMSGGLIKHAWAAGIYPNQIPTEVIIKTFDEWTVEYNKVYPSEWHRNWKMYVFAVNLVKIKNHNEKADKNE